MSTQVKIGDGGKIEYDIVGMMKVSFPYIISTDKINVAFVYDLFERKFINASLVDHDNKILSFEVEPHEHGVFVLTCNREECILRLFDVHVKREIVYYGDYDEEQTKGVTVDEVYHVNLGRDIFRSISNCKDTPDILAFVAYLIPIDLPDVYFNYMDVDEIISDLKKFFES